MPNAIGTNEIEPISFRQQIVDAGLGGVSMSYTNEGEFNYGPLVTQVQKDQVHGVYTRHNPLKGSLVDYANNHQWALATGGYTVTIDGVLRKFETDSESQSLIDSTSRRISQSGAPSVDWQFEMHVVVTVRSSDFITSASKIGDFIQATFSVLQDTFAGIDSGAIKNEGDVNKMPWPEPYG